MSERLIHYSAKPFTGPVRSVKQGGPAGVYKPCGLWFSVEDGGLDDPMGWREWCEAEGFALHALTERAELMLAPTARLLRLRNARDIDRFTKRVATKPRYPGDEVGEPDWHSVAAEYQGIIIAPYVWSRRLSRHTYWYYGWDCASGCIWDAAAVAGVRPIKQPATVIAALSLSPPQGEGGQ